MECAGCFVNRTIGPDQASGRREAKASQALSGGDLLLARWLFAWGDAFITGMLVAIFVAFRPQWLATYADRIYLPRG